MGCKGHFQQNQRDVPDDQNARTYGLVPYQRTCTKDTATRNSGLAHPRTVRTRTHAPPPVFGRTRGITRGGVHGASGQSRCSLAPGYQNIYIRRQPDVPVLPGRVTFPNAWESFFLAEPCSALHRINSLQGGYSPSSLSSRAACQGNSPFSLISS